jgi:hypothetical protein
MTPNFADWVAICETKARYCRCLDTKDWAGYRERYVKCDDGRWRIKSLILTYLQMDEFDVAGHR